MLEQRESAHLERETRLETLVERIEAVNNKEESTVKELEQRVNDLELMVTSLKNAWRIVTSVAGVVGGLIGFVVKLLVDIFKA